jgi:sugar fermentation stimulation protein A
MAVPLMKVDDVQVCRIIQRLNRFVVKVEIRGKIHPAHINNTGRLQEFLIQGKKAFCFPTKTGGATDCRLFAIAESGVGALIDTQLQMKVFEKMVEAGALPWLKGTQILRRNPRLGNSVLDYLLKDDSTEVFLEVKCAVLREGHFAMYPDCPTIRGQRHVRELIRYAQERGRAIIVFMAALPHVTAFKPHRAGDPILSELLQKAQTEGVKVRAIGLHYTPQDSVIHLFDPDLRVVL